MVVPLAVAVPWLAPEATATLVGVPPERFSVIAFEDESYATVALVAPPTGAAVGVTAFDAADAVPVPTELVAFTVNVYAVPLVRPVTVIGEDDPVAVKPPGDEVAV
jgi:hypothetical protein